MRVASHALADHRRRLQLLERASGTEATHSTIGEWLQLLIDHELWRGPLPPPDPDWLPGGPKWEALFAGMKPKGAGKPDG